MANKRHIQHVRSSVVNNGKPKLPVAEDLLYGEIAINYHAGTETVSLKNDSNEIVTFHDEVEITSGDPKVNTEIWIDTSDETSYEVYTKEQMDLTINSLDQRISALESQSGGTAGDDAYEVQIGTSGETISANTKIFIDTDTGSEGNIYVYTKEQVDALIADLQRQIDELNPQP